MFVLFPSKMCDDVISWFVILRRSDAQTTIAVWMALQKLLHYAIKEEIGSKYAVNRLFLKSDIFVFSESVLSFWSLV